MSERPDLRDESRKALNRLPESSSRAEGARVERVIVDVTVGGRTEMVTMAMRDGRLVISSSDGEPEGEHAISALKLVAGVPEGGRSPESDRPSRIPGGVRTVEAADAPASADRAAVADAIQDVVTAVARIGVKEAKASPTVDEAVKRLVGAAPSPLPLGISRWVGRLRTAVADRDLDELARVLEGASRVAEDLRMDAPSPDAARRIAAWLGATGDRIDDVERLYERTLLEVAREWLHGIERSAIERRYLVDLESGSLYREERTRGAVGASVGPCPRLVQVAFAEVEGGAEPRRIRLLQYAVSANISRESWARVSDMAARSFSDLAARYRDVLTVFPGLAEPFAVVTADRVERDHGVVLVDGADNPLPIARVEDPGLMPALIGKPDPWFLSGRLVDSHGQLLLHPCSVAFRSRGHVSLFRLS